MQHPSRTISALARAFLAALVVALLASVAPAASASSTKEQLDAAKRRFEQLKDEIAAEERRLSSLKSEMVALAGRLEAAEGRLEKAEEDLRTTQRDLAEAKADFEELRAQLAERARAAYIEGPGNDLEFLLGATSLADLADRVQFVDALSQSDLDLATKVQNLANRLSARAEDLEALTAERERAVEELDAQEDALFGKFSEQQQLTESIDAKLDEARGIVAKLSAQYERELEALREESGGTTGGAGAIGGILEVCPTDQPRVIYDGFGAPRYGGGYHPHGGNDIIAPTGTAIRAPFDGTARSSSNYLGGNAVYVYGAKGYVYNAHLSRYSSNSNGPVKAGDIIGYVGSTGNSSTPHNHFEWHPKVMPSSWPTSPYGFRTVGSAVNPWPILQSVC